MELPRDCKVLRSPNAYGRDGIKWEMGCSIPGIVEWVLNNTTKIAVCKIREGAQIVSLLYLRQ